MDQIDYVGSTHEQGHNAIKINKSMKLNEILNEAKGLKVYHGDNHGTQNLNPSLMNNGNNQEGIGIYFSSNKETAESYGKYVISTTIDLNTFIPSRDVIGDHLSVKQVQSMLHDMWDYDNEDLFYWVSDWFMVEEPSGVTKSHINSLAEKISSNQVRNFQIELAEKFGVEAMVRAWNKHTKVNGTHINNSEDDIWVAIINPAIGVTHEA